MSQIRKITHQRWLCAVLGIVFLAPLPGFAQDFVRAGSAQLAAQAGRFKEIDPSQYNLRLGPVFVDLTSGFEVEYNDNVNLGTGGLTGQAPEADLFFRPRLDANIAWQATKLNTLTVRLGLAYEFSLNNTRASQVSPFTLAPNSEIGFDFFIGETRLNLHDRFSLQNNPAVNATASNTVGFAQFDNTAGVTAWWYLNALVITASYDLSTVQYLGGDATQNQTANLLSVAATLVPTDTITAGAQMNVEYRQLGSTQGAETTVSAGPFAQFQVTPFTRILVAGGLRSTFATQPVTRSQVNFRTVQHFVTTTVRVQPSSGRVLQANTSRPTFRTIRTPVNSEEPFLTNVTVDNSLDTTAPYFSVALYNRLNAAMTESLSVGQEPQFGADGEDLDTFYIRYGITWRVNHKASLDLGSGYERVGQTQLGALTGASATAFDRWTASGAFGYVLSSHLSTSVRYQYYSRSNAGALGNYRQNIATVGVSYNF